MSVYITHLFRLQLFVNIGTSVLDHYNIYNNKLQGRYYGNVV